MKTIEKLKVTREVLSTKFENCEIRIDALPDGNFAVIKKWLKPVEFEYECIKSKIYKLAKHTYDGLVSYERQKHTKYLPVRF